MARFGIALALIVVVVIVAQLIERRRRPAAPTQPMGWTLPAQLDRADFAGQDKPWLVVVFSSATCDTCAGVIDKARVVACDDIAFDEVPWQDHRDVHDRYGIEVVPATLVAGRDGVVRASFVGDVTATDLWAAVAEARAPGSSPEPDLGGRGA